MTPSSIKSKFLRNRNPYRRGRVQHPDIPHTALVHQAEHGPACAWLPYSRLPKSITDAIRARYELRAIGFSDASIDGMLGSVQTRILRDRGSLATNFTCGDAAVIGGGDALLSEPAPVQQPEKNLQTAAKQFLEYRSRFFRKHASPIVSAVRTGGDQADAPFPSRKPRIVVSNPLAPVMPVHAGREVAA